VILRIVLSGRGQFSHMSLQFWLALLIVVCPTAAPARAQSRIESGTDRDHTSILRGTVVDARTLAPLERVLALVEPAGDSHPSSEPRQRLQALTDVQGRFELRDLPPGVYRLTVSLVGYGLYRREVTVGAAPVDLEVRLSEGATSYSETVIVTPDAFRAPPDPVPSASVLGSAALLNLRGVLADDPLRAVQVLPGVATGDDLRSEFTVRGSDFTHLTFTVDGFATPYLLHTVRGVEDRATTGSVAMINSDVLDDVTLMNGGYPQRFGGHTGAEVDFRTREGSRTRPILRAAVSGTSASTVAEGPLGRGHRGSWLVSGRQSYIDHLVRHLTERSVSFGFSDVQGRLAYDLTPAQHLDVTLIAGHSRFLNEPGEHEADYVYDATNAAAVGVASWRLARPRLMLTQRILAADNHFHNENLSGVELDDGKDRQLAYRADATAIVTKTLALDAGAAVERRDDSRVRRRVGPNRVSLVQLDDYSADAFNTGAHASAKWTPRPSLTIAPGLRVDRWTLTDQSTTSPWVQTEWRATDALKLRAAAGRYQQFPDFDKVLGASGGTGLVPESAAQYDAGFERRLSPTLRVSLTAYDREEAHMLRRPGSETRVVGGRAVRGIASAKYENRLDGFARGVELMVQRTVAGAGVSGWLSYAYSRNRYRDTVTGETFWGDFDQRHTMNAYGLYRHSERLNFVAKLRVGSNFPIPGYYAEAGGSFYLTDVRNTERLPVYARLDLRANRAFTWSRTRLTLFAEVINVLNRANYRFEPPGVNLTTRAVTAPFDSLLPIVPSVGCLFEF
jgi:TonB dependent receptor-like, beta-barrel/Carboxypeptidase regulatory-like domain